MVLAILVGFALGTAGFFPLYFGWKIPRRRWARKGTTAQLVGAAIGLLVTMVLYIVAIFIVNRFDHSLVMPFGIAASAGICVAAVLFGIKARR